MPKPCQKAETWLHLGLVERNLVHWAYEIYLTNKTEEQATSYLKSIDAMENQSHIKIYALLSAQLIWRTLPLDNHLTSKCKRSCLWSACISWQKTANVWGFIGRAFTKFMTFNCLSYHSAIFQGHIMLKPWYSMWSSCGDQFSVLQHDGLSCILSKLLLCMYECQHSLPKKYLLLWNSHSLPCISKIYFTSCTSCWK